jgi:hypothetical protein
MMTTRLDKTNDRQSVPAAFNPNEARRRMLLRSISLLAVPVLLAFAVVMFLRGNWIHGLLNLGVGLAVTLGIFYLPRFGKSSLILRSISASIGLLLLYDMALGGANGEMLLWMFAWPLLVFFAHGKKEGLLWMIPMLLAIQVILWLPPDFMDIHPYPTAVKIRFLVSYIIVTALAFFFESTRQLFQDGLVAERAKIAAANRTFRKPMPDSSVKSNSAANWSMNWHGPPRWRPSAHWPRGSRMISTTFSPAWSAIPTSF